MRKKNNKNKDKNKKFLWGIVLGLLCAALIVLFLWYMITNSIKNDYVNRAKEYISVVKEKVASLEYNYNDESTVYYFPLSCVDKDIDNSFEDGYVVMTYNGYEYEYRFYAKGKMKYGIENVLENDLSIDSVVYDAKDVEYELFDDKYIIKSMDRDTCSIELVEQSLPYTSEECFEVFDNRIIKYNSDKDICGKYVSIPKEIKGRTIEIIDGTAFQNMGIKYVVIPNTIKEIRDASFRNNSLVYVEIPSSVTKIEGGAFTNNQLSNDNAFIYARNSDGTIDYSTIVSYAGKERENVVIPGNINGVKLKKLDEYSFTLSNIKNVEIPDSVEEIGFSAFSVNELSEVSLPSNLKIIGGNAFYENKLTTISIPKGVIRIEKMVFALNYFDTITIPNSVQYLDKDAFLHTSVNRLVLDKKEGELEGEPWRTRGEILEIIYLR